MSLKTRFLLATIIGNFAVFGLLSVTLIVQRLERNHQIQQEKATFAARELQDWLKQSEHIFKTPSSPDSNELRSNTYYLQKLSYWLQTSDLFEHWILTGPEQSLLASDKSRSSIPSLEKQHLKTARDERKVIIDGNRVYFPIVRSDKNIYTISTSLKPFSTPGSSISDIVLPTATVMVLGTILLVIVLYLIYDRLLFSPLEKLVESTRKISDGDYTTRLQVPDRQDEIHTVFSSFNSMSKELESYHDHMEEKIEQTREEMKKTRKKLLIAQRLSSMGTLAAGIAHEINNPLGGMMNAAKTLQTKELSADKQIEYLEIIQDGLKRIRKIVQQVLNFAPGSRQEIEIKEVNIQEILQKVLNLEQHRMKEWNADVRTHFPEEPIQLEAAPSELQQAFLNILKNALDACRSTRNSRSPEISIAVEENEKEHQVSVVISDNGCGMSDEEIEQAFDPFFTTKDGEGGTGLGLSITYQIIENHGGSIDIESREGEGTTFSIHLPMKNRSNQQSNINTKSE